MSYITLTRGFVAPGDDESQNVGVQTERGHSILYHWLYV